MKKRILLIVIVLSFLFTMFALPAQAVSYKEFEAFLNATYPSVDTPMGIIELEHSIYENPVASDFSPYNIWIKTDWQSDVFSPYAIKYGIDYSEKVKREVIQRLSKIQISIYQDAVERYPNLKIRGGYIHSFYEYPTLKVGLIIIDFLTWTNYTDDHEYDSVTKSIKHTITMEGFKWDSSTDDYDFTDYADQITTNVAKSEQDTDSDILEIIEDDEPESETSQKETSSTKSSKTSSSKYATVKSANLYAKASTSSDVVLIIPKNKPLKIVAKNGNFYKVEYMGNTGYVLKTNVKTSK